MSGFLFGVCSDCCRCPLCCFASRPSIDWQDPGDLAYPGDSPAGVVWNYVDASCPTEDPFLNSIYILSVMEPDEFEIAFYCDDYTSSGDFLEVTVIESDISWQTVTVNPGTFFQQNYRRPNGTAVLRIDSNARPGVSCRLSVEFDADFRVAPATPGRALARVK